MPDAQFPQTPSASSAVDLTDTAVLLRGSRLRALLTLVLDASAVPQSVPQLVDALAARGVRVAGRPSKAVSDALRWEVKAGRVVQTGRGWYAAGRVTKQTRHRLRRRVRDAMSAARDGRPVPR